MNAYELADALQETEPYYSTDYKLFDNAANMLRQQADRIAELEKQVKRLVGAEPITHGRLTFCKNCGQQDPYAQTKPLSDEEIMDIAEQSDYSPVEIEMGYDYEIRIAKAIEERHGIK